MKNYHLLSWVTF